MILRFEKQDVRVETPINLLAGEAMVTCLAGLRTFSKAIDGFCKLQSHLLLPNPFVSKKEVAVNHLIRLDRPLKQVNGLFVPQDIFKRHNHIPVYRSKIKMQISK
jgi:hypothetical protein